MVFLFIALVDTSNLDNEVFEIAKKLNCLVCLGESVAYSQSQLAVDMRNKIRDMLKEGKSEKQILDYFVSLYGEKILAEPPKEGFYTFLWLMPYLVLSISLIGIIIYFLTKKK